MWAEKSPDTSDNNKIIYFDKNIAAETCYKYVARKRAHTREHTQKWYIRNKAQ